MRRNKSNYLRSRILGGMFFVGMANAMDRGRTPYVLTILLASYHLFYAEIVTPFRSSLKDLLCRFARDRL